MPKPTDTNYADTLSIGILVDLNDNEIINILDFGTTRPIKWISVVMFLWNFQKEQCMGGSQVT